MRYKPKRSLKLKRENANLSSLNPKNRNRSSRNPTAKQGRAAWNKYCSKPLKTNKVIFK